MFKKKLVSFCIFVLTISLFTVQAHWVEDPGPSVIKGGENNLHQTEGGVFFGDRMQSKWEIADLHDAIDDSEGFETLTAQVYFRKSTDISTIPDEARGSAYCQVWCAKEVSDGITKGSYDVHARARGRLWWREDRHGYGNEFQGGISKQAERKAVRRRYIGCPTYSGVHLWGKALVKSQAGELDLEMKWH